MLNWIRRMIYIGDVGRWDARRNYPGEADFIEIPLHDVLPPEAEAAGAAAADAQPKGSAPAAPANDSQDPPREIEA